MLLHITTAHQWRFVLGWSGIGIGIKRNQAIWEHVLYYQDRNTQTMPHLQRCLKRCSASHTDWIWLQIQILQRLILPANRYKNTNATRALLSIQNNRLASIENSRIENEQVGCCDGTYARASLIEAAPASPIWFLSRFSLCNVLFWELPIKYRKKLNIIFKKIPCTLQLEIIFLSFFFFINFAC